MKVKIINASDNLLPKYATEGSAALDLMANEDVLIIGHSRVIVPTGLFVAVPEGYVLSVRPRSGLAIKSGITVLNTPGTIDSDYRGEIKVILYNTTLSDFHISKGDRIAQAILEKYEKIEWEEVVKLDDTERGEGGFGSSGI